LRRKSVDKEDEMFDEHVKKAKNGKPLNYLWKAPEADFDHRDVA
jgi:hypothetical protein